MAGEIKQSARFEFPSMLYDMLEEVSEDAKLSKVVSWMPHGHAFKVHKPDDFEAKVMPKYFRERYSSFRYLLEQWGFHGLRRGRDRGAYYNALFVRGERHNIENATKELMLSVMPEYLAPKDEPDFYSNMPPPSENAAPINTSRTRGREKRKQSQVVEVGDIVPKTKKKAKPSLKKTKKPETQQSETKALASENDDYDPSPTGSSSSTTTESWDAPPLRRTVRNTPRVQYSEAQRQPKVRQNPTSEEAIAPGSHRQNPTSEEAIAPGSHRKLSRKSKGDDAKAVDPEESMGKDPLPILFRPTKPVFSGFGISFEKLRLIVMNADEVESHESFVVKRLGSTGARKQTSH